MKLVVAIDGKDSAETALEHILQSKYGPDTVFHLVHVLVPGFAEMKVSGIPDPHAEEQAEEKVVLDQMEAELRNKVGAQVTSEILTGEVADVIATVCKRDNADEAIVPRHVRHGFSRLWFGSVADEIVDSAPCSVLVLKMPEEGKH